LNLRLRAPSGTATPGYNALKAAGKGFRVSDVYRIGKEVLIPALCECRKQRKGFAPLQPARRTILYSMPHLLLVFTSRKITNATITNVITAPIKSPTINFPTWISFHEAPGIA
jgi:hypothetical protein